MVRTSSQATTQDPWSRFITLPLLVAPVVAAFRSLTKEPGTRRIHVDQGCRVGTDPLFAGQTTKLLAMLTKFPNTQIRLSPARKRPTEQLLVAALRKPKRTLDTETPLNRHAANQIRTLLSTATLMLWGLPIWAADHLTTVNVDNFTHAETDMQMSRIVKASGGANRWSQNREPTPLDKQSVIRMNRDTLYSFAVVDISKGATLPEADGRYMTTMVVNNDGYMNKIYEGGGTHELTLEEFDTPCVVLAVRTLVDASDPADVKAAKAVESLGKSY